MSCEKTHEPRIWDFINYDIEISVTDSDGNDLLDPECETCIPHGNIWIEYKSEKYLISEASEMPARANIPIWEGLRLDKQITGYRLLFGEFSPEPGYRGETLALYLGESDKYEIKFNMYVTYDKKQNPRVHKKIWLDEEQISDQYFQINIVK